MLTGCCLGDEKSDVGHIKCPRGQQVPHLCFTCYCCSSFLMSFASFLDDIQAYNCIYAKILQFGKLCTMEILQKNTEFPFASYFSE